jgi:hypothetical protein
MQSFHGRIWGFVQEYDTMLLVWNKDAFQKSGLDPNNPHAPSPNWMPPPRS